MIACATTASAQNLAAIRPDPYAPITDHPNQPVGTPSGGTFSLMAGFDNSPRNYEFTGGLERTMRIEPVTGSVVIRR
jgi:hypothetical protein